MKQHPSDLITIQALANCLISELSQGFRVRVITSMSETYTSKKLQSAFDELLKRLIKDI